MKILLEIGDPKVILTALTVGFSVWKWYRYKQSQGQRPKSRSGSAGRKQGQALTPKDKPGPSGKKQSGRKRARKAGVKR